MNASEIESLLQARSRDVVMHLFPNAKIVRNEAQVGSIAGEPGESLKVCINGSKIGHWADFAGEHKGKQLIQLWHSVRNTGNFFKTLQEASEWLGVGLTSSSAFKRSQGGKAFEKAVPYAGTERAKQGNKAFSYLSDKRGLNQKTIIDFRIGEKDGCIFFPTYDQAGLSLQMGKYLGIERGEKGEKDIKTVGQRKSLFGKHLCKIDGGDLVICEGEIDAMSLYQLGCTAVSVPFGAKCDAKDGSNPNDEWIENDYEFLECFSRIYLCFDSDEPGRRAAVCLVKRLGIDRCYLVKLPEGCKDANEALLNGKSADLIDAIDSAKTIDPTELKIVDEFDSLVWDIFHPNSEHELGVPFLFREVPWRIRPGELTIWTGHSGHGKSTLLNHLLVHMADLGQRSCLASFEMAPKKSIHQLVRQISGLNHFEKSDKAYFDEIFEWMGDKFWIVDRVGKLAWKDLIEIFSYARKRYRINQFVVDSLLRCGIASDDYDQQKSFVDALVTFAQNNDSHVHLVAHSRKKEDEKSAPGKLDVAGAGEITHLAHNVVSVYRNKVKQDEIETSKMDGSVISSSVFRMNDGHMEMHKQRETGDEPRQRFWFLNGCAQFSTNSNGGPKQYVTRFTT